MTSFVVTFIALGVAFLGFQCRSTAQEPVPVIRRVPYQSTGAEGTLVGTVTLTGDAPKPRVIDTSADPVCGAMNSELLTEDAVVNDGKIANVVVYLERGD